LARPSKKTPPNTLSKQTPTAILQCFQLAQIIRARELLHLPVAAIVGVKAYDNRPLLQLVPRTILSVGPFWAGAYLETLAGEEAVAGTSTTVKETVIIPPKHSVPRSEAQ